MARRKRSFLTLLALGLGSACAPATETAPTIVELALGEPTGDYPSYDERVVLYGTNRARTDPAKAGWPSYPAQPPLEWNYDLNRSSRAHSIDMRDTPCFQHQSCDGTDPFQRINTYYTGPQDSEGENISAGVPDGLTAVYNWLFEIGAARGETGHRDNIFSKDFTLLGVGFAAGGTDFQDYWTQDFVGTPITRPHLSDGIHFPVGGSGGKVTFGATYYDDGGQAASRVQVIVDGACNALPQTRGTPGNATYEGALQLASGCHAYYFRATVSGVDFTYPDTGSLGVGIGGGSCALFQAGHQPPACDSSQAGDDGGSVSTSDGGLAADDGGSNVPISDDGGGMGGGGDAGMQPNAGCGCTVAGEPAQRHVGIALLLVLAFFYLRSAASTRKKTANSASADEAAPPEARAVVSRKRR
jgi:MYXO-CTERM domain-containing protein